MAEGTLAGPAWEQEWEEDAWEEWREGGEDEGHEGDRAKVVKMKDRREIGHLQTATHSRRLLAGLWRPLSDLYAPR